MNGFPPPVLVETWLNIATNNNPEFKLVQLLHHRKIKNTFGSMELAQLYIEKCKDEEIEIYYV